MKKCRDKERCYMMFLVLQAKALRLRTSRKTGKPVESIFLEASGQRVRLSLCPWCGAKLIAEPVLHTPEAKK